MGADCAPRRAACTEVHLRRRLRTTVRHPARGLPRTGVRLLPTTLLATLTAALPAQALRLVDRVEAPMLYLSLSAAPAAAQPKAGEAGARERPRGGAVQELLADPAFDVLFGRGTGDDGTPGQRALALVRGVLARSSGDLELALTGVVPGSGQPLLVFRASLLPPDSERLQGLLEGNDLAEPNRVVGGRRTWSLRSPGRAEAGPGQLVEIALVGTDLLVANDATAVEELLADDGRTAVQKRLVLSADPRFTSLRQRLAVPPGSLLVYGDWLRLAQRLQDANDALPAFLFGWSGLGAARTVMASLSGEAASFRGTVLLDFDRETTAAMRARPAPDRRPEPRDGPGGTRPGEPRQHWREPGDKPSIDGWLASVQSVPARSLVAELPSEGLGGLVLAVDLADVGQRTRLGHDMVRELRFAFADLGLDFERNVVGRLGTRGTAQLYLQRGATAAAEVACVYALRAKSRSAAQDLFQDLRRAAEQHGSGRLVAARDRKGIELLELRTRRFWGAVFVAVVEDSVLLACDAETLAQGIEEMKRARSRGRRDAAVVAAMQAIGGEQVAGLFDVDLSPWFAHLAQAFAPGGENAPKLDLARIPKRHVGYLDVQQRTGGAVLRLCVLSSQ